MTGVRDLQQMEKLREKLRNLEKQEPNQHQHVLNRQILDLKISEKKKIVKESQQQRKATRGYRHQAKIKSSRDKLNEAQ